MGSLAQPTPRSEVDLIAWDPDSKEHVERLYRQRVACGWKQDMIEKWRGLQREGKMAIQWVVSWFLVSGSCFCPLFLSISGVCMSLGFEKAESRITTLRQTLSILFVS